MVRNRKLIRFIVDLYENFNQQIGGNPNFKCRLSDNQAKMIDNFILTLDKDVGLYRVDDQYLIEYFEFAFNHWRTFKGTIMLEWIIGKEAYKRWVNRNKKTFRYKLRKQIKKDVVVKTTFVKKKVSNGIWKEILIELNPVEESFKEQFFNTTKGFTWCYVNTTLYNHKSPLCAVCKNSTVCKKALENEHSNVFKLRGY